MPVELLSVFFSVFFFYLLSLLLYLTVGALVN